MHVEKVVAQLRDENWFRIKENLSKAEGDRCPMRSDFADTYVTFHLHRLSRFFLSLIHLSISLGSIFFSSLFPSRSRAHSRWRFDCNEEKTRAAERQKETAEDGGRETWSRVKRTPVPTGAQQERRRAGRVDKTGGPHRRDSWDRELALGAHGARTSKPLIHEFSLRRLRCVSGACRRIRSRNGKAVPHVIRPTHSPIRSNRILFNLRIGQARNRWRPNVLLRNNAACLRPRRP